MKHSLSLAVTGFLLIAVSYGLARFSWGLMLPAVSQAIPFSPRLAGVLSACSFLAYCLSVALASRLCARYGARLAGVISALCAAAGLLLLAVASSPLLLAAGLLIAGFSAGLASPSLAAAVSQAIPAQRQTQVNTIINAGTGAGIILSVPLLLILPWRYACVLFAAIALLTLLPVWRYLPSGAAVQVELSGNTNLFNRKVLQLAIIACISGMASAAWWSFGPEVLRQHAKVADTLISLLWLVCGAAGMLGVLTGPLARLIGMRHVYRLSLLFMAAPLVLIAFSHDFSGWLFPAVALCGAGYITLSGVLLVGGAQATPQRAASGVGVVFFMLAAGQVAGSMLFGVLYAQIGAAPALIAFTLLAGLMLFYPPAVSQDGR
ncbi:MFS transporter [Kosakonia cowanii]|uniref:MFS transporter n=1 Tax=Kosakonia cowanii TaxID=208223 RepID=UPI0023F82DE9|nr:MFS transporter [Kosakonia cowanii]MDF7761412.1 MFS transporter [Kosakonia cowanii]